MNMHKRNEVTVVMYHYVRALKYTRYPEIKGLDIKDFKKQLKYLQEKYSLIRTEDCIACLEDPEYVLRLPDNPALLTFDDGYLEHFTHVFPLLDELNIEGAFFPPVMSSGERKALNVNKIHFILAAGNHPQGLLQKLAQAISRYKNEFDLLDSKDYYSRIDQAEHPYDPMEVIIFKRVLQRELPSAARNRIIQDLFSEIVNISEEVFVNELYMNADHLKCMRRNGMFIGGHGYSHKWLNHLRESEQENEIKKTKSFLDSLGVETSKWVMCYPYGAFNGITEKILEKNDCKMAFTTRGEKAVLSPENRFSITRIDTNEIGK